MDSFRLKPSSTLTNADHIESNHDQHTIEFTALLFIRQII